MKKFVSVLLALTMVLSLAACGGEKTPETTVAPETTVPETTVAPTDAIVDDTAEETLPEADPSSLEGIINSIYAVNPVEFMTGNIPVDLTDTSDDGLWTLNAFTGLENADLINEAWVSEAMIGSIPYSLVLVRVADAANAETVADAMKSGINQRKWICVEADDLKVTASGDVVMLVMIGSENGNAQSFVDAFASVMGSTDFVK